MLAAALALLELLEGGGEVDVTYERAHSDSVSSFSHLGFLDVSGSDGSPRAGWVD